MAKPKITPISIGISKNIPLNQLKLSDDNVRKIYSQDAIADLAADIRTNGLIQSLSVRTLAEPDGVITHEVQGGGRRYRALQMLVKQKALAGDAPIPCIPNDSALATQISLAENTARQALHPLDEYRAFAEMLGQGKTEDDIANAFRVSVHTVRQRLRLGSASPVLHKAFQDEKITLQLLMAFCVTDNHERQETVWAQVQSQTYLNTFTIKQMLMENTVPYRDKRVGFVGIDTYVKAGGTIEQDLFTADNEGYLTDPDLLNKLVQARLDREADTLKAKGWQWVKAAVSIPYSDTSDCDQLTPENETLSEEQEQELQALESERDGLQDIDTDELTKKQAKRLQTLEAAIDAIENREPVFTPEDMARAGVTLEIGHDGRMLIEYGFIKQQDGPPADDSEEGEAAEAFTPPAESPQEADDEGEVKIPDSLVADLTIQRTACLQAALSANPDVAFLATLHALTLSAFYHCGTQSCLQLTGSTTIPQNADALRDFAPMKAMLDQRKAWKARLPENSSDLWEMLQAMDRAEHMQLLAFVAATTLNVVVQKHDKRTYPVQHSHVLANALDYEIRNDWTPTAENFFGRVTKATMLASVAEARDEHTAHLISHMKKVPMAGEAQRLVDGTGWIPAPMRTDAPAEKSADDEDADTDEGSLPDFLHDSGEGDAATANA